jgi:hypothetical protein
MIELSPLARFLTYLFLVTVMLSVGLQVTGGQLLGALKNARLLGRALVANLIVVPILGPVLVRLFPMPPDIAARRHRSRLVGPEAPVRYTQGPIAARRTPWCTAAGWLPKLLLTRQRPAWITLFRRYSPRQPWSTKTWKPGDFELVE